MRCKDAYLVINPRAGQDMTRITDVIAVLSAAGWKTDNALVEYGGHAGELAAKAVKHGYDLIIAHGGDGTTNEVVNAVMNSKERQCIVGVLPGGTANQWAHEIGVPVDPVKAALALVNSDARNVDVGRIQVQQLTFPTSTHNNQEQPKQKKSDKQKKAQAKDEHYFLLTAGLGIDASIISHTSKSLKARIGRLAFDVAATKELPEQHPFSVAMRTVDADEKKHNSRTLWQGEALQIVLGNTRLYADVVELTPDAIIDDGQLDVCIIKADSAFTTVQQIASLLLRHKPDNATTQYERGAHFTITVPASINLQLDGSALDLHDYLSDSEREALHQAADATKVLVTYRVDVMTQALRLAIPRTYDNTLFEHVSKAEKVQNTSQRRSEHGVATHLNNGQTEETQHVNIDELLKNGQQITVVGTTPYPEKHNTFIIAGSSHKKSTGDIKPAAVRVDDDTLVLKHTGEHVTSSSVQGLQEGTVIVVEGKESKRGVIQATHVVIQ